MITAKSVHRKLDRLLNRLGSNHSSTYTVTDKDDFINQAIEIYQENVTGLAETNSRIREDLRPLLISGHTMSKSSDNGIFTTFSYPDNYYRRLRVGAKGKFKDCPERRIKIIIIQRDDLSNVEDDVFWNPSFEWGETIAVESKNGLEVYHNGVFELTNVTLDYYFELPKVFAPELVVNGVYEHPETGQILTKNQDFILEDYQLRKILAIAALLFRVARGDQVEFQLELSKIINVEKLHLN